MDAVKNTIIAVVKESIPDIAEAGLDSLLQNGIFREIPMLRTILAIGEGALSIRDILYTRHILMFASSLRNGNASCIQIEEHLRELEKNPKLRFIEMETIMADIARHDKYIKDQILANFYSLFISNSSIFDWEKFVTYSEINNNIFVYDICDLQDLNKFGLLRDGDSFDMSSLKRLRNIGLVNYYDGQEVSLEQNNAMSEYEIASITEEGRFFCEYGLSGVSVCQDIDGKKMII